MVIYVCVEEEDFMKKVLENLFFVGVLVFILGFVYIKSEPVQNGIAIEENINCDIIT